MNVKFSTLVTVGDYLLIRFNPTFGYWLNVILMLVSGMTLFIAGLGANFGYDLRKIIVLSILKKLGFMKAGQNPRRVLWKQAKTHEGFYESRPKPTKGFMKAGQNPRRVLWKQAKTHEGFYESRPKPTKGFMKAGQNPRRVVAKIEEEVGFIKCISYRKNYKIKWLQGTQFFLRS